MTPRPTMGELERKLAYLTKNATSCPAWVRQEIAECAKLAKEASAHSLTQDALRGIAELDETYGGGDS